MAHKGLLSCSFIQICASFSVTELDLIHGNSKVSKCKEPIGIFKRVVR